MSRRRPAQVRTDPRPGESPEIAGISPRLAAGIVRLERSRNYLWPGIVTMALVRWHNFVREPGHRFWSADPGDCGIWECCGDPHLSRDILEGVLLALPRHCARELQRIVDRHDELY
ncbi:hypothetical protein [Actinocrispum sp. NPDC049592]|uniref:hypothetical protein n=1 Tax=Actinocrispum sp. NPDC049592 TaxID=3154835 RepID=UPI0034121ED9